MRPCRTRLPKYFSSVTPEIASTRSFEHGQRAKAEQISGWRLSGGLPHQVAANKRGTVAPAADQPH
jgi:hypothetical protein